MSHLDLGTITLDVKPRLKLGKEAPPLVLKGLDGAEVSLKDFAGKFVLLVMWSEARRPSDDDIWFIKLAQERNAKDGKLVVMTVELTGDAEAAKRLLTKTGLEGVGTHCVGRASRGALRDLVAGKHAIPREYFATGHLVALIDPDGKVVGKNLHGEAIELSVYQAIFAR